MHYLEEHLVQTEVEVEVDGDDLELNYKTIQTKSSLELIVSIDLKSLLDVEDVENKFQAARIDRHTFAVKNVLFLKLGFQPFEPKHNL
jgi:hypothetical protein